MVGLDDWIRAPFETVHNTLHCVLCPHFRVRGVGRRNFLVSSS
jgi:hypothetical protein